MTRQARQVAGQVGGKVWDRLCGISDKFSECEPPAMTKLCGVCGGAGFREAWLATQDVWTTDFSRE